MGKKKLQLSEIKVNSFVTPVSKADQKTTKGGYVYREDTVEVGNPGFSVGTSSYTEIKTRILGDPSDYIQMERSRR